MSLGERAAALDWLERAYAARDGMLYSAPLNVSWFAPIWDEPRFQALRGHEPRRPPGPLPLTGLSSECPLARL